MWSPVGSYISEMRVDLDPGDRSLQTKGDTAALLYGGDRVSQKTDVAKAKDIASRLED